MKLMNASISMVIVNKFAQILKLALNVRVILVSNLLMTGKHVKILMNVRCLDSVVKTAST